MSQNILGIFLLVIASGSAYVIESEDSTKTLTWPTEYHFAAERIDLIESYVEPYEVWYSAENNKSRIEYYNGTYKEFYVAGSDDTNGFKYTVHPITTETARNVFNCFVSSFNDEIPDYLPYTYGFEYLKDIELKGRQVQVWKKGKVEQDEGLSTDSTIYAYRTEYNFDIPLKKVSRVIDTATGVVEADYIINYNQFGYIIHADDVTYDDVEDCDQSSSLSQDFKKTLSRLSPHRPEHVEEAFNSFKKHHKKNYHAKEHDLRKEIFHKSWRRMMTHNSKDSSYKMGLNEFSDWTDEELQSLTGTIPSDPNAQGSFPFPHSDEELELLDEELPESYDLRLEGYLGPIKNQGSCGSCWAFTTTATVEGLTSKFYGERNLDLSEQSLVDCAWGYQNYGCGGGQLDKAYEYILKYGIPKESDYGEYMRKDGFCRVTNATETFKIKGFAKVTPLNPTALKLALVKYGPVAVAIHASENMKSYAHGIFYDITCTSNARANHGVVLVGYGVRDGTPYWIIRNSWGEGFGLDGYILISQVNNNCLVMSTPFYPIV